MTKTKTKTELFERLEKKLNKIGFKPELAYLTEFMNGKTSVIKFVNESEKNASFTINLNAKILSKTILWSSKMSLRQENTILNLLLADAYLLINQEDIV